MKEPGTMQRPGKMATLYRCSYAAGNPERGISVRWGLVAGMGVDVVVGFVTTLVHMTGIHFDRHAV